MKGVEEFFIDINENEKMKEEILKLKNDFAFEDFSEDKKLDFISNGVILIAKKYGYNFTVEDYLRLEQSELNEEELENVSGGKFSPKSIAIASGLTLVSLGGIVGSMFAAGQGGSASAKQGSSSSTSSVQQLSQRGRINRASSNRSRNTRSKLSRFSRGGKSSSSSVRSTANRGLNRNRSVTTQSSKFNRTRSTSGSSSKVGTTGRNTFAGGNKSSKTVQNKKLFAGRRDTLRKSQGIVKGTTNQKAQSTSGNTNQDKNKQIGLENKNALEKNTNQDTLENTNQNAKVNEQAELDHNDKFTTENQANKQNQKINDEQKTNKTYEKQNTANEENNQKQIEEKEKVEQQNKIENQNKEKPKIEITDQSKQNEENKQQNEENQKKIDDLNKKIEELQIKLTEQTNIKTNSEAKKNEIEAKKDKLENQRNELTQKHNKTQEDTNILEAKLKLKQDLKDKIKNLKNEEKTLKIRKNRHTKQKTIFSSSKTALSKLKNEIIKSVSIQSKKNIKLSLKRKIKQLEEKNKKCTISLIIYQIFDEEDLEKYQNDENTGELKKFLKNKIDEIIKEENKDFYKKAIDEENKIIESVKLVKNNVKQIEEIEEYMSRLTEAENTVKKTRELKMSTGGEIDLSKTAIMYYKFAVKRAKDEIIKANANENEIKLGNAIYNLQNAIECDDNFCADLDKEIENMKAEITREKTKIQTEIQGLVDVEAKIAAAKTEITNEEAKIKDVELKIENFKDKTQENKTLLESLRKKTTLQNSDEQNQ
ncbi:MAG: hypothetical protein LBT82_00595 [Oscillospiraceae bacterium]|jgi:hypothetical protein|nr:hypothetical protein [Oscillospiraceae bacterium]